MVLTLERETEVRKTGHTRRTGRYSCMLTPQETLFTGKKVDPRFLFQPYTPIWIQMHTLPWGTVDIERTNKLIKRTTQFREKIGAILTDLPMKLAKLDVRGDTVESPTLFGSIKKETRLGIHLPFPRSSDPDCDNFYDSTQWIEQAGS